MQHLNEEQIVSHYFHDDDAPAAAEKHLAACAECRAQYDTICGVLALVANSPVPERSESYADEVWTRLRWKLGAKRRRSIRFTSALAAAAVLAFAFFAGQWWHARNRAEAPTAQQQASFNPRSAHVTAGATQPQQDRVLVFVVSDHLETSERMLTELANADPKQEFQVADQQERAAELVASNRIYRQTASTRGDRQIASLLADLEPILLELSHAGKTLAPDELASMQKRIDSKGLLFKVRVMSAQNAGGDQPPSRSNSL
jgi:hypothetical protein